MEQKIRELIKQAMIQKNKPMQITYKNILETAQKTAKRTNSEVTEEMLITAAKNEIKQLEELLSICEKSTEQYAEKIMETKKKIEYCKNVLPKMATEQEIREFLTSTDIPKNIGMAMKALKERFGAYMDSRMASQIAKEYASA